MTRQPRRLALLGALALPALIGFAPTASDVATTAVPACAPAEHPGGEWRVQGHDLANTRHQPAETTIGPDEAATLEPVWELNASSAGGSGSFTGTPVISGGCLFSGSTAGWVFANNADTGELVWATSLGRAINNSVAVHGGKVYALTGLRAVALDQATGAVRWESDFIDDQDGADLYGSPVVASFPAIADGTEPARDIVFVGVSGGGAELGDEEARHAFHGAYTLLDGATGEILTKRYTIPQEVWDEGYAGAGVWATPAFDPASGHVFVGTANPFQPQVEHDHANSILKIDVDPRRATFGDIVGHYKGSGDTFVAAMEDVPCVDIPGNPPPWYPQGAGACMDADLDFGASPNLFTAEDGRLLVGEGQKSGEYHVLDAETMEAEHVTLLGPPTALGGIVGSTAFDGASVYGPVSIGGYLWSLDPFGGTPGWVSPVADGLHWAHAVSSANGVVYTIDVPGFLRAYDAGTGMPLLANPQSEAAPVGANLGGGVAIARNTVYAVTGSRVVAHRPGGGDGGGGGEPPVPVPGVPAGTVIAAHPSSFASGYTTRAAVVPVGGELTFVNGDLAPHDVVAFSADGSDDQPWCGPFKSGDCPLFWSELIGLGESTPVLGTDHLTAGQTYDWYCTIHPSMRGTLVAVDG
ncbi:MAG: PQQ-binding-like beta-propeller repeat protein [Actinobacteria bacterium]|nr:PQQ-binding-like beta-propeller repeat protein [Actinomycetota bacterium]